jgi:DNA-binding transcriptional MerR regulator
LEHSGLPGRPKLRITEDQLSYLSDNGFTAVDMARMFGVSQATIHRRLKVFNVNTSRCFSDIDDNALDDIIRKIKLEFPNSDYRMMLGHLKARGLIIQQLRVRESMKRIDPEGTVMRWLHVTERRKYSVSSPNALWHIDGHHKLTRSV